MPADFAVKALVAPDHEFLMLSAIIAADESERALVPTLACLVPGVTAGMLRDVILADADDALPHEPGRRHQAGMNVPDRLGLTSGARRVHPQRDLV